MDIELEYNHFISDISLDKRKIALVDTLIS